MPIVSKIEAIQRISATIEHFACDDLVEVHNELFPDSPQVDGEDADCQKLTAGIQNRIQSGLDTEEIVDLWNVVFPKDRNVWYDDETETVHFNEEAEHVESTD